jgi:hypothetical protein
MFHRKGENRLYTLKFDHSRFRERIIDGFRLACFSEVEGVDDDYLRYEIMESHQKQSIIHHLGKQIRELIIKLYVVTFRTNTSQKMSNKERIM